MPKLEGVQVVEQIRERFPDAAIVILTTYDTDNDIERALRAGAKAFLVKDVSPQDLVACVRAVHAGRTWTQKVAAKLVAHVTNVRLRGGSSRSSAYWPLATPTARSAMPWG